MGGSHPNHFISIPRSLGSLKHYSEVHDQPFSRTIVYLLLLAVLLTGLGMAVAIVGFWRDARAQAAKLKGGLGAVRFENGKATADVKQPCILWEDVEERTAPVRGPDGKTGEQTRRLKQMIVVLDTTGKLDSVEKTAEFAGCAEPARYLFLGTEKIESVELPENPREKPKTEDYAYSSAEKLAEVRKLIEANGGTMPRVTVTDGAATFDLPPGKVHLLVRTAKLLALVDASGKKRTMNQAVREAVAEDPGLREQLDRPEFLVLLTASGAMLKAAFAAEPMTWTYPQDAELSSTALADWVASAARRVRTKAMLQQALPTLVWGVMVLFIGALVCSIAGLITNGVLRGGLIYGELLTVAVYAMTPAVVAFLVGVLVLGPQGGSWVLILAAAAGVVYTALGTWRTAKRLGESGAPTL